jgi:hypothetical protein
MSQPEGSPSVITPIGGQVSVVQNVSSALQAMVCRIMSLMPDVYECELHIKYFLSYFEKFDCDMRKSNDAPSWITSYNFICLTNIPYIIEDFGPGKVVDKVRRLLVY